MNYIGYKGKWIKTKNSLPAIAKWVITSNGLSEFLVILDYKNGEYVWISPYDDEYISLQEFDYWMYAPQLPTND